MKTARTSKKTLLSRKIVKEEPKPEALVAVIATTPRAELVAAAVKILQEDDIPQSLAEGLAEAMVSSLSPSELTKETQ